MRKRGFIRITIPSKYLLLMLTLVCAIVLSVSFTTDIFSKPLNNFVGFIVTPFQQGVSFVGTYLSDRGEELVQIKALLEENAKLKEQVNQLTTENNSLQQEKYELNNLRQLYKLDEQYPDYEKVGARVIGKDPGNWFHTFVIDKGSEDGIKLDMNVMAGSGLVGRVVYVGPNWSKVISIIDDESNVSAMALSTSDTMIVSGNLEYMKDGMITFSQLINTDENVKEGDKIVTSSISDKYLPGILIGYISSIKPDSNNLTYSGMLLPAVDFAHIEEVLVIIGNKQSTTITTTQTDSLSKETVSGN